MPLLFPPPSPRVGRPRRPPLPDLPHPPHLPQPPHLPHRPHLPRLPLSILVYRQVVARPDPLFPEWVEARQFEQHLRLLTRWFRVMPLGLALRQLRARVLPSRAACITFDAGYAESADVALPLLQRWGVSATFFVAAGYMDGSCPWADRVIDMVRRAPGARLNLGRCGFGSYDIGCAVRRRAVIDMLLATLGELPASERLQRMAAMACLRGHASMLGPDQVLALHRAGMAIGAHPSSHAALAALSNADARSDIANGRTRLEALLQDRVSLFSYPNGLPGRDFEQRHANMLRAQGFEAAVTSAWGATRADTDLYALPRYTPLERSSSGFLLSLGSNLFRKTA